MNIANIIKLLDGGIAVSVMIFIGWRLEKVMLKIFDRQSELIDKLTNSNPNHPEERD